MSVVYSSPRVSCVQQSLCQLCTAVRMSVVYSSPYVSCVRNSTCQLGTDRLSYVHPEWRRIELYECLFGEGKLSYLKKEQIGEAYIV